MSKANNLTDFLTDVADAIRTKKGTSNLINPQDFSSEILSIPTGGGGDGTLPITIPPITAISFSTPNLTITPGDYSDIESYNPTISYVITFNNTNTAEFGSTTCDILDYLNEGSNTLNIVAKSTIRVSESQENVAYSTIFTGTVVYTRDYANLDTDFIREGANARITFSDDNKTMEFYRGNWSGGINLIMTYLPSVADFTKVEFQAKGNGANPPYMDLMYSLNGTTFTTLDTIAFNDVYNFQPHEYNLPEGTVKFRFQMRLNSSDYDPHIGLKNVMFK